jgi:hypothetical protein
MGSSRAGADLLYSEPFAVPTPSLPTPWTFPSTVTISGGANLGPVAGSPGSSGGGLSMNANNNQTLLSSVALDTSSSGSFSRYTSTLIEGEPPLIHPAGQDLWLSFLVNTSTTPTDRAWGLELYRMAGSSPDVALRVGRYQDSAYNNHFGLQGAGTLYDEHAVSRTTPDNATTHLLCVQMSFRDGMDDVKLFVDPASPGWESGTPDAFVNTELAWDRIGFYYYANTKTGGGTLLFDEVRIGTTAGDVARVPEPGLVFSAASGVLTMLGIRRRSRRT